MSVMVTPQRTTISLLTLAAFLATPLSGEVFAQSASDNVMIEDQREATTTEEVTEATSVTVDEESWYQSEQIFGQIEVGDFVVGPGRKEIELVPGQTVVEEIIVTNRISDERTFKLEVEDVVGSIDPEQAVEVLDDEISPYSVRSFISFPHDTITLGLGERARIPVTISIPPDAEPGGYYGSVLVSTVRTPGVTDDLAPRSPVIARVGSLFFITISGETERIGETKNIQVLHDGWWHETGPVDIGILYENSGSVHLNPYGELSITNMFGEEVGFLELEPWFVLPQSLRLREVSWDREFLLGRYTIHARINRGYDDVIDEQRISFWVLPWKVVGGIFLVLFIVLFSLRAFSRTFEFKRKGA